VKQRHRFRVCADILKASVFGSRKTYLIGLVGISFKAVSQYLEVLVKRDLLTKIAETSHKNLYLTTVKGRRFLKHYEELVGSIGLTMLVCAYICNIL